GRSANLDRDGDLLIALAEPHANGLSDRQLLSSLPAEDIGAFDDLDVDRGRLQGLDRRAKQGETLAVLRHGLDRPEQVRLPFFTLLALRLLVAGLGLLAIRLLLSRLRFLAVGLLPDGLACQTRKRVRPGELQAHT